MNGLEDLLGEMGLTTWDAGELRVHELDGKVAVPRVDQHTCRRWSARFIRGCFR